MAHSAAITTDLGQGARRGASLRLLGTLGMFLSPGLAIEGALRSALHLTNLQSTPLTNVLGLLYLLGWALSAIGMAQLAAACNRRLALIAIGLLGIGLLLAASQQIAELTKSEALLHSSFYVVFDLAWPLSHLYMLVLGIIVFKAQVMSGWRRVTPSGCGLVLLVSLLAREIWGTTAMEVSLAVLSFSAFLLLGLAVRTSLPAGPYHKGE